MSVVVSIRNIDIDSEFRKGIVKGNFKLPQECEHNANILYQLLSHMPIVVPSFKNVHWASRRKVAEVIAFVLRPDLLHTRIHPWEQYYQMFKKPMKLKMGSDLKLKNDPSNLHEKFKFTHEEVRSEPPGVYRVYAAMELWRCFGLGHEVPGFKKHVSYDDTVYMADAMGHILNPKCFSDYEYAPEIIAEYQRKFRYDLDTI